MSIVSEGESLFGDLGLKLLILGIKLVEILYIIPPIPPDPQVIPALTLYILDLQNDNDASILE